MEDRWRLGGREVPVKNLEKPFFPGLGLTKGDVLGYYRAVAPAMLAFLKDRPLTLYQCPDGVSGRCFYRRKLPDYAPDWFPRVPFNPKSKTGQVPLILAQDEAQLIWLANQAAIEFHAWASRLPELARPDLLVLDLDPGPAVPFARVLEAARVVREALGAKGLAAFPKTSGGRGLHLLVPIAPGPTFAEVRAFARALAEDLFAETGWIRPPKGKAHEGTGVQLDYAQNGFGRNTAAPYSLRARPGAPVSTPLFWEEVERGGFLPGDFTLKNVPRRLAEKGDPLAGLFAARYPLPRP